MSSGTCSQTNSCGNEDVDYDFDYSTHYTTRPKRYCRTVRDIRERSLESLRLGTKLIRGF